MKRIKPSSHKNASQSTSATPAGSSQIESAGQAGQGRPIVERAKGAPARSRAYEKLMKLVKGAGRVSMLLARLAEPCLEGSPFKAVPAVFTVIAEAIETVKDTKDDADALLNRLYDRLSMIAGHCAESDHQSSQTIAADFIRELFDYADKINRIAHAPRVKVLDAKKLKGDLEEIVKHIDRTTETFHLRVLLDIERDTKRICDKLVNGSFDRWNRAPAARFKADIANLDFARQACTKGTRVDVLNKIYRWAIDTTSPPIFWLSGMAGSGKSTIAYTICKHFSSESTTEASLGASFFCSRQVSNLRQLGNIMPTIAYQLARHSRLYALALDSVNPDVIDVSSEQVEELLLKPWTSFANKRASKLPLNIIVIDALDEIEQEGGVQLLENLIDVVDKLGHERMRQLKIFVTSRPHPRIVHSSARLRPDTVFRLEDIEKAAGLQDISTYLNNELPSLAVEDPGILKTLNDRADGLFIYAATVVRILFPSKYSRRLSPREQQLKLSSLLDDTRASPLSQLKGIHKLYEQVLVDAIAEEHRSLRLPVLHRIMCALQPLSIKALSRLAGVDTEAAASLVYDLHSVLYISELDGCVYVYHKSFSDFMLDDKLSGPELACNQAAQNEALSCACFRIMRTSLHFNMCSLPSSYLLDSEVPNLPRTIQIKILSIPGLEYACRYWSSHTSKTSTSPEGVHILLRLLLEFIDEKVLFWIEAMNLLGANLHCYIGLQEVATWADSQAEATSELKQLLRNVRRFAQSFLHTAASESTPHLYVSCLATEFATNLEFAGRWKASFPTLSHVQCSVASRQDGVLARVDLGEAVTSVAFSPDGSRIASGSNAKTVRIWSVLTGEELHELNGHTKYVYCVAFSPNGSHIVSGSKDWSVRVWKASTGEQLQQLNGHASSVKSVAFSPNRLCVASGSEDKSVRIWNMSTGAQLQKLDGHTHTVYSVAYSPDGLRIVSGSGDMNIQIWDALTGAKLQSLKGHTGPVSSVVFSPDGSRIASGSRDHSLRIWEVLSGAQAAAVHGHTQWVYQVAFSSDGSRIVSGSKDQSVRIWDALTGAQLHKMYGHMGAVRSVAFSPDGSQVVSGSNDNFMSIWDASTAVQLEKPANPHRSLFSSSSGNRPPQKTTGHTSLVKSVAFSPDGLRIVSGSYDRSVRIWDSSTGVSLQRLNGHSDRVISVAFSPDGSRIASGSRDQSVRVWDASTGAQLQMFHHAYAINCVAFSPDGLRIASGSNDRSVRIWDVSTGVLLKEITGHTEAVHFVMFLPDGFRIVSGSDDGSARLWDASTGVQLRELNNLTGYSRQRYYRPSAFSPDGLRFATESDDGYVRVWDLATGVRLQKLKGHTDTISSVMFSPYGSYLVSGSRDKTVRVWHVSTGAQLREFNGHTGEVKSVAFSPDGSRVVSSSEDNSVRIWSLLDRHSARTIRWAINGAGWVVTTHSQERLLWLPKNLSADLQDGVYCKRIISEKQVTLLDFSRSFLGLDWAKCYQSRSS